MMVRGAAAPALALALGAATAANAAFYGDSGAYGEPFDGTSGAYGEPGDAPQAATTMAGCTCANPWEYEGSLFRGTCENPDDDPLGEWCVVADASTCTLGAPVGNNFDYCAAPEAGTGVAVEVPTELVGDWEGTETHVGGTCELRMSTVAGSTMLSMSIRCEGSDEFVPYSNDILTEVACTGDHRGYYHAIIAGRSYCHSFEIDPDTGLLTTKWHQGILARADECDHIDTGAVDAELVINTLAPVSGQLGAEAWLCQPHAVPAEFAGEWTGSETFARACSAENDEGRVTVYGAPCALPFTYRGVQYDTCTTTEDVRPWCSLTPTFAGAWAYCADVLPAEKADQCVENVQKVTCSTSMTVAAGGAAGTLVSEYACEGADESTVREVAFEANVRECGVSDNGSPTSEGVLKAYSNREFCYLFERVGGTMRMAYHTTTFTNRKHHICPDTIEVGLDVAVVTMELESDGANAAEWMCTKPMQELPLAERYTSAPPPEVAPPPPTQVDVRPPPAQASSSPPRMSSSPPPRPAPAVTESPPPATATASPPPKYVEPHTTVLVLSGEGLLKGFLSDRNEALTELEGSLASMLAESGAVGNGGAGIGQDGVQITRASAAIAATLSLSVTGSDKADKLSSSALSSALAALTGSRVGDVLVTLGRDGSGRRRMHARALQQSEATRGARGITAKNARAGEARALAEDAVVLLRADASVVCASETGCDKIRAELESLAYSESAKELGRAVSDASGLAAFAEALVVKDVAVREELLIQVVSLAEKETFSAAVGVGDSVGGYEVSGDANGAKLPLAWADEDGVGFVPDDSSGLPIAGLVGGIVGGLVVVAGIAFAIVRFARPNKWGSFTGAFTTFENDVAVFGGDDAGRVEMSAL